MKELYGMTTEKANFGQRNTGKLSCMGIMIMGWALGSAAPCSCLQNGGFAVGLQRAIGGVKVHSCINIYNFWKQFCDRFAPSKYCLRKFIRQIEETISFVIFPKCFVIFPKCFLRRAFFACRMAVNYPKSTGVASRLLQSYSGAMQR